ncbi:MAG: hypothetical protein QW478_00320 [Candidatus Micrarchaeaceae archaeon]
MEYFLNNYNFLYPQPPEIKNLVKESYDYKILVKKSFDDKNPTELLVNKFVLSMYIGDLNMFVKNSTELEITPPDYNIFIYYIKLIFNEYYDISLYPQWLYSLKMLELLDFLNVKVNYETALSSTFVPKKGLKKYIDILKRYIFQEELQYKYIARNLTLDFNVEIENKKLLIENLEIPNFVYSYKNVIYIKYANDSPVILEKLNSDIILEALATDKIGKYFILSFYNDKISNYYQKLYLTNGYLYKTLYLNDVIIGISSQSKFMISRTFLYDIDGNCLHNFVQTISEFIIYFKFSYDDKYIFIITYTRKYLITLEDFSIKKEFELNDLINFDFSSDNNLIFGFKDKIIFYDINSDNYREELVSNIDYLSCSIFDTLLLSDSNSISIRDKNGIQNHIPIYSEFAEFTYNKRYIIYKYNEILCIYDIEKSETIDEFNVFLFILISKQGIIKRLNNI